MPLKIMSMPVNMFILYMLYLNLFVVFKVNITEGIEITVCMKKRHKSQYYVSSRHHSLSNYLVYLCAFES